MPFRTLSRSQWRACCDARIPAAPPVLPEAVLSAFQSQLQAWQQQLEPLLSTSAKLPSLVAELQESSGLGLLFEAVYWHLASGTAWYGQPWAPCWQQLQDWCQRHHLTVRLGYRARVPYQIRYRLSVVPKGAVRRRWWPRLMHALCP